MKHSLRASASRQKGTLAETAVVSYLLSEGFQFAERRALHGVDDRGDITGIPGLCIEVKNCARTELAEWLKEAIIEGAHAKARWAVVWHKLRGKGNPADWPVTMPGWVFIDLLKEAI